MLWDLFYQYLDCFIIGVVYPCIRKYNIVLMMVTVETRHGYPSFNVRNSLNCVWLQYYCLNLSYLIVLFIKSIFNMVYNGVFFIMRDFIAWFYTPVEAFTMEFSILCVLSLAFQVKFHRCYPYLFVSLRKNET